MTAAKRSILEMNAYKDDRNSSGLLARRLANAGATSVLFYREPIEMISASGTWMQSADGVHYLDFYNNVPSVGHCHPQVVEAISTQSAVLNINTRYLHETLERYVESLKATLPAALSNVVLTCSGSEANDLALRIAEKVTGNSGYIVTENAYHGNTRAVTEISPASLLNDEPPDHVVTVPAPGRVAFGDKVEEGFLMAVVEAASLLETRGHPVAALVCDSIFSSDGIFADPSGFLAPAVAHVRARGGLYIADEVQPGFARTGTGFWGYQHHGVEPDMVTMGKPMGNGYPMAGVAAPAAHLEAFCSDVGYFNTYGGSPVAAAAGLAVLHIIRTESLQENALRVGKYLLARLTSIAERSDCVSEVRQLGLFMGVELSKDRDITQPDPALASRVIHGLRGRRVLIGAAGKYGNTLKVRPPLCLSISDADFFADALEAELVPVN